MTEHPKITFTRNYCKAHKVRYMIKGVNDALYIYNVKMQKYLQVCYSLLNLNERQIVALIDSYTRV